MKTLEDNSVDSIVTDPPYGLSFMGKKWDYDVPSKEIWQEAFRVLKHGGHLLSFGGTRTYHRLVVNIEDAGFEIRDCIQWLYGSGFPKSHNIKEGDFKGFGTALKPANEPICVARKPLEKGLTVAENVLKYGTGAINVDGSRISTGGEVVWKVPESDKVSDSLMCFDKPGAGSDSMFKNKGGREGNTQGRWPANIIFDEEAAAMLDEQSGQFAGSIGRANRKSAGEYNASNFKVGVVTETEVKDFGGASRFFYVAKASKRERNEGLDSKDLIWESEAWEKQDLNLLMENIRQLVKDISVDITTEESKWNTELCGSQSTDQLQTGLTYTISTVSKLITELKTSNAFQNSTTRENIRDAIKTIEVNGLSLVESVAIINQLLPSITNEKTASVLGVVHALLLTLSKIRDAAKTCNFHSTVKPIKLMEYLIKLVTPPNGTVLDPFMGSGSTGVAAKNLGFNFTGIEMNEEYFQIAQKRIENVSNIQQL